MEFILFNVFEAMLVLGINRFYIASWVDMLLREFEIWMTHLECKLLKIILVLTIQWTVGSLP